VGRLRNAGQHSKNVSFSVDMRANSRKSIGQGVVKVNAGAGPVMGRAASPLDGRPRCAENFDPEHPLAGDSRGRSLAARFVLFV
jgi:hypothetical protein